MQHELGREAEARATLAALETRFGATSAENVAEGYAWLGDRDRAFEWLHRARGQEAWGLQFDPLLRNLRDDPRWRTLLRSMKLPVR